MKKIKFQNKISLGLGFALILFSGVQLKAYAKEAPLGSRLNPLKMAMVPSQDAAKIMTSLEPISKCLNKVTGYYFKNSVPSQYIVLVESLGSGRIDLAFLNTFSYLVAAERYQVVPLLKVSRFGSMTFQSQIVVRTDSKIASIKDLAGKKMAYVDTVSTAGYLMPKGMLINAGVKTGDELFAGSHDAVITAVYQKRVDAGATFYTPPHNGEPRDARYNVRAQFPDIFKQVKILQLTDPITNEPITVRKELPDEMKEKLKNGFLTCMKTNTKDFEDLNRTDGFAPVKDADYNPMRDVIQKLKIDMGGLLKK